MAPMKSFINSLIFSIAYDETFAVKMGCVSLDCDFYFGMYWDAPRL